MRQFELQVFWNECAQCGLRFETLGLRGDDRPFIYDDGKGTLQYLDPFSDPVWREARALMESAIGGPVADFDQAAVFHRLMAETVDPPEGGAPFGSAWEQSPCPRCGSRKRKAFGPIEPPQFRSMDLPAVSHSRWNALAPDEKRAMARRIAGR